MRARYQIQPHQIEFFQAFDCLPFEQSLVCLAIWMHGNKGVELTDEYIRFIVSHKRLADYLCSELPDTTEDDMFQQISKAIAKNREEK